MTEQALPCIVCGKPLQNTFIEMTNQPSEGTAFESHGHYGSTAWDPMDGQYIEVNICDPCLVGAAKQGKVLQGRETKPVIVEMKVGEAYMPTVAGSTKTKRELVPWDGIRGTDEKDVLHMQEEDIGSDLYPEIDWNPALLEDDNG